MPPRPFALGAAAAALAMTSPAFAAVSVEPSAQPPASLAPADVPQFVMLGFDDNPDVAPMEWILRFLAARQNPAGAGQAETHDGAPLRVSFYTNGKYLDASPALQALHRDASAAGHEIANHTQNHEHGAESPLAAWRSEIGACEDAFARSEIPVPPRRGFRTPFLEHATATFEALAALGFAYDTSLEEGYQPEMDGTNFLWPYTLDAGSPGNAWLAAAGRKNPVGRHRGLWEIPVHAMLVPPDAACARYGVRAGLRARVADAILRNQQADWPVEAGKITGFDWNLWESAELSGDEVLALLKHTLDLRLKGNRAPLMVGAHTALYPADRPERRHALEAFIDHALRQPDVRIVPALSLVEWMEKPTALRRAATTAKPE